MAEHKNTGLAVPDAKRLNDCYHELCEAIAARPSAKGDRDLWQFDYAALSSSPEGDERESWNHRCGSNDVALVALRGAVTNGNLQLWTYGPRGEAKVDRYELKEPTFPTFASGTYQPENRRLDSAGLADNPLWVKEADWHRFMLDLWAMRYGADWANPAPPADAPKLPPESQFVTLSHALSYIAFGVSMSNDHLHEVLSQDRYGEHQPQEAVAAALDDLLALAGSDRIAVRGRYRASRDDDDAKLLTDNIEAIKFDDYRQFSYLEDELRNGKGLLFWHNGSGQVFHDTFGGGRKDSFVRVTVKRADLMREIPPKVRPASEAERFRVGHAFTRDDPAPIAPWWSVNQALAWIACGIPSYVDHVGKMESELYRGDARYLMAQVMAEAAMAACDEAHAFMENRRANWPEGAVLAHAGRELLKAIRTGEVKPAASENGRGRAMPWAEFAGVGLSLTGGDWLTLDPQPLFASAEVMGAFSLADGNSSDSATARSSTVGAECECRAWLENQFAADPQKLRTKDYFRSAALAHFSGRLTKSGFNLRVWPTLALQHDRSTSGAKRKS